MHFSLEQRSVTLGVGEFATFALGPQESGGGPAGLWRAQLGQHWHQELRQRTEAATPGARFEVPIEGRLVHRGWTFHLNGRIDQVVPPAPPAGLVLREIKSVTRELPADEAALRAEYPEYFRQLAVYLVLLRAGGAALPSAPAAGAPAAAELVFVEAASGLIQTVPLGAFDEALVGHQLDALAAFLDLRAQAAARRRTLAFRPPFTELRPGQENLSQQLTAAFAAPAGSPPPPRLLLFEAPTGYGKTGCILEFALGHIRAGRFARLVWLTGKATGQLHVVETLRRMAVPDDSHVIRDSSAAPPADAGSTLSPDPSAPFLAPCHSSLVASPPAASPLAAWQVRPKSEHCINHTFHCLRDSCEFLHGCAERWPLSGLARFYLDDRHPRDLPTLQAAGRGARICPYEITRASLAFNDVWIGDFNYVFAPDNRGIFADQPGYDPAETLLVVDEAHNLPARVADAYSHAADAAGARAVLEALHQVRPPATLLLAWENWCWLLNRIPPCERLAPALEADVRDALDELTRRVTTLPVDHAALGPAHSEKLWEILSLHEWLADETLEKLLWSPRAGTLAFTCIDAAPAIGATLRAFGGVLLMSGTISPADAFAAACGLDRPVAGEAAPAPPPSGDKLGQLTKRDTRKLFRRLASGSELLRVEEARASSVPAVLRAAAPWRDGTYDVAVDLRVDTTLKQRGRFYGTTAETVAALHAAARGPVAVFFPSYAYAEAVQQAAANHGSPLRVALQPRRSDLAAQNAWVEESLLLADALFLVLGSSFSEGIDLLGGRITHALVVGPALPEVNAVQKARLAALGHLGRDAAFRRVYQVPGLQKVNQALGRLVRAPGHRAKVLLHCRRFADPSYAALLAPEYQLAREIANQADLVDWLAHSAPAE